MADISELIAREKEVIEKLQQLALGTTVPGNQEAFARALLVHAEAIGTLQRAQELED